SRSGDQRKEHTMTEPWEETLRADIRAKQTLTEQGLPPFQETARWLASDEPAAHAGGRVMQMLNLARRRPRFAGAVAAVVVALVLGVIPVPYHRTVVQLSIAGRNLDAGRLRKLAGELKRVTGAKQVTEVIHTTGAGGGIFLMADTSRRSEQEIQRAAAALARELSARGLDARVRVEARTES